MKSPYLMFLGPVAAVALGILFKFRLLPFLRSDTILSGGRQISTADFAGFMSRAFFIFAAASLILAVTCVLVRRRKQTREN